jgi:hypothetical protein
VVREGQPLTVRLRDPDHGRPLLVAAVCRGRLVAQQYAVVPAEGATVRLTPAPGVRGVLRLTVYGVEAAGLRPLAERLVYCKPAAPLQLTAVRLNAGDQEALKPGDEVTLKIAAAEGRGTTVLAAVQDERLARLGVPQGVGDPAAFFYLTSELDHPEALEDAEVLLGDGVAAERALDLFLGTQGWRRFADAGPTTELTLWTADNLTRVEAAARAAVEERQREAWEKAAQARTELQQERRRRALAAQDAAEALAEYRALPGRYAALAAVAAIGVLFVLFVAGVAAALVQTARGRPMPRVALGGACGALLLGVAVHFATEPLRGGDRRDAPQVAGALLRQQWSELPRPEAEEVRPGLANLPQQVLRSVKQGGRARDDTKGEEKDNNRHDKPADAQTEVVARLRQPQQTNQTLAALAAMDRATPFNDPAAQGGGKGGTFGKGKDNSKDSNLTLPPTAPVPAGAGGEGAAKREGDKADQAEAKAPRQYTYTRNGPTDLLLWQPALTLTDGSAVVRFPLPPTPGAYRVLLYGNTPDGRLGFQQQRLESK